MIRPNCTKWGQTPDDLRRLSTEAEHPRTRERFLALYMIATGRTNATRWAEKTDRVDESILKWVHTYNEKGPEAMTYRPTGGRAPLLRRPRSRSWSRSSGHRTRSTTTCPDTAGR
jgi:hypothetical protein